MAEKKRPNFSFLSAGAPPPALEASGAYPSRAKAPPSGPAPWPLFQIPSSSSAPAPPSSDGCTVPSTFASWLASKRASGQATAAPAASAMLDPASPNGPPSCALPLQSATAVSASIVAGAPPAAVGAAPSNLRPNTILASRRQRGNPVLAHVRHVGVEFGDVRADYILGQYAGALYISLRYHLLHPDYLFTRMKDLRHHFRLRLLLCQVDIDDHQRSIQEISRLAINEQWTLILAFSFEEAGRYLETFRAYETKGPESIQERPESDYLAKLQDVLTQIRAVNKTDVLTLAQTFGSLKAIMNASMDELALCPGLGEKKVRRIYEAFHEPLQAKRQRALQEDQLRISTAAPATTTAGGTATATATAAAGAAAARPTAAAAAARTTRCWRSGGGGPSPRQPRRPAGGPSPGGRPGRGGGPSSAALGAALGRAAERLWASAASSERPVFSSIDGPGRESITARELDAISLDGDDPAPPRAGLSASSAAPTLGVRVRRSSANAPAAGCSAHAGEAARRQESARRRLREAQESLELAGRAFGRPASASAAARAAGAGVAQPTRASERATASQKKSLKRIKKKAETDARRRLPRNYNLRDDRD
eukprot:tig00000480_g1294.t1